MKKTLFLASLLFMGLFIANAWAVNCDPNHDNKCQVKHENKRCDVQGQCVSGSEHTCYKLFRCEKNLDTGNWEWKPWSCSPTPGEPTCPSGV